jgi:hypothetical protein
VLARPSAIGNYQLSKQMLSLAVVRGRGVLYQREISSEATRRRELQLLDDVRVLHATRTNAPLSTTGFTIQRRSWRVRCWWRCRTTRILPCQKLSARAAEWQSILYHQRPAPQRGRLALLPIHGLPTPSTVIVTTMTGRLLRIYRTILLRITRQFTRRRATSIRRLFVGS